MAIIVNLIGGLGNQMFQYATGYAMSKDNDLTLKLDIRDFDNNYNHDGFQAKEAFKLKNQIISKKDLSTIQRFITNYYIKKLVKRSLYIKKSNKFYIYRDPYEYDKNLKKIKTNIYLDGHWQHYKYFNKYKADLMKIFHFSKLDFTKNPDLLNYLNHQNLVSVHIRKGDYISNKKNKSIFFNLEADYFCNAVNKISSQIQDPFFLIFSDDIKWVKSHIKFNTKNIYYVSSNDKAILDMSIMSQCRHHIISNSTFSWWPAWLKSKASIVIAPKKWLVQNKQPKGLIMKHWQVL